MEVRRAANSPVRLRPLRPEDAGVIAGWGDDPGFCRAAGWSPKLRHRERLRFFRELIASPPDHLIRLSALHEGTVVGYVDLQGTSTTERELGFVVGERSRWSRGLGRAVAAAGVGYGFENLGLRMIWAETSPTNFAATRVLKAIGMHEADADAGRRFEVTAEGWRT